LMQGQMQWSTTGECVWESCRQIAGGCPGSVCSTADDSSSTRPVAIFPAREWRGHKRPDIRDPTRRSIAPSGGVVMRKTILAVALVAFASPLWAQAAQQAKENDPTHKVAGGISVAGWKGRIDPQAERRGMKLDDAKLA